MLRFDMITIFPEMFAPITTCGISRRALEMGIAQLHCWDPRQYTHDKHKSVDDRPYGGGPGMVMKIQPLRDAIAAAKEEYDGEARRVIYLSPQGEKLTQEKVRGLTTYEQIILVSGRYEGIDQRLLEKEIDEEISIGDYVLSNGEIAAMAIADAVIRLLPGALGSPISALQDSFSDNLLDYPHYTRPEEFEGQKIPSVLMSGNHEAIRQWRLQQALGKTWLKRPDLFDKIALDP